MKLIRFLTLKFGSLFYDIKYLEYLDSTRIIQSFITQKIFRINSNVKFPCGWRVSIHHPQNIIFDSSDIMNFHRQGNHFCAKSSLYIGKGTIIGPYAALVTAKNLTYEENFEINIGKNCQICLRSIILPGVVLGDYVIVAAGAIVTRSFGDYSIIGGNPARLIRINEKLKEKIESEKIK